MTQKDIKSQIKESLDYKIFRRNIISACVITAVSAVFIALISLYAHDARFFFGLIPICAMTIPQVIINLNRMKSITEDADHYFVTETVLSSPKNTLNAGVYFTVKFKLPDGTAKEANTRAVGCTRGIDRPHFSDLADKKALIAYNTETGTVVVLNVIE